MTRFYYLLALLLLGSPAHAGESFSFTVAGHRIHIEAPRHCNSASCVSVSIPGIYESRRHRNRDDDVAAAPPPAPAPAPVLAAAPAKPVAPVAAPDPIRPVVAPATKAVIEKTVTEKTVTEKTVTEKAVTEPVVTTPPPAPAKPVAPPAVPRIAPPPVVTRPAPQAPPRIIKVEDEEEATTPLGDWQTEGKKGSVRIEACGRALCGYVINPRSDTSGESVLINMKPKDDSEWSGNIYSRDSKNTYYATIAMQGPNALRVEACAFGRFFCTGNTWSRIRPTPERLITSRQIVTAPRS